MTELPPLFNIEEIMSKKIELNYDKLDALLQFRVSLNFCADYLGVSEDTIRRRLLEDKGMSFTDYSSLKRQRTAFSLTQKVVQGVVAEPFKNAALTIFTLKNVAGWTDKEEHTITFDEFNFVGDDD